MSYDLMVFEPSAAPRERARFMEWYDRQTQWSEGHSYDDPQVTSPALQDWFREMIQFFPAMNGPYASADLDDPRAADYCIGKDVIYAEFAWSCADDAYARMRALAMKHKVGFFDVSTDQGEIVFPEGPGLASGTSSRPWWKVW